MIFPDSSSIFIFDFLSCICRKKSICSLESILLPMLLCVTHSSFTFGIQILHHPLPLLAIEYHRAFSKHQTRGEETYRRRLFVNWRIDSNCFGNQFGNICSLLLQALCLGSPTGSNTTVYVVNKSICIFSSIVMSSCTSLVPLIVLGLSIVQRVFFPKGREKERKKLVGEIVYSANKYTTLHNNNTRFFGL